MIARTCPHCGGLSTRAHFGPLELEVCAACPGAWFDFGELRTLIGAGPAPIQRLAQRLLAATGGVTRAPSVVPKCPHCTIPLSGGVPGSLGVRVFSCLACKGDWVLAVDLARIAERLQAAAGAVPGTQPGQPASGSAPSRAPAGAPEPAGGDLRPAREEVGGSSYFATPPAPGPSAPGSFFVPPPADLRASTPGEERARPPASPPPVAWYAAPPPEVAAPPTAAPRQEALPPDEDAAVIAPGARAAVDPDHRVCRKCGEQSSKRDEVCWACGHVFRGTIAGTCPRCRSYLRRAEVQGVRIGGCEGCGGAWLESGRLSALAARSVEEQQDLIAQIEECRTGVLKAFQRQLYCTKCELMLFPTTLMMSDISVDSCPGCGGAFLDHGRLAEVLALHGP